MSQAQKFACWVLGIKTQKLKRFEIPVPQQGEGSNDCGLYAMHFLREFMINPDEALDFCLQVRFLRSLSFFLMPQPQHVRCADDDPRVLKFWDSEHLPRLRAEAITIFDLYKALDALNRGEPQNPTY